MGVRNSNPSYTLDLSMSYILVDWYEYDEACWY
jgi:hypothetical protein